MRANKLETLLHVQESLAFILIYMCSYVHCIYMYMYGWHVYYVHTELTDTRAIENTLREQFDTSGSSHTPPSPHTRLASPGNPKERALNCLPSLSLFCLLPVSSLYSTSPAICFSHTLSVASLFVPLSLCHYILHVQYIHVCICM